MMYTVGGSMCALYGHSLPYAARALACVVLAISWAGGLATAAVHPQHRGPGRRGGPPYHCSQTRARGHPDQRSGHVVGTFVSAGCAFFPQRFADIPGHLVLTLAAGSLD
ncbi:hypothetical protein [Streptomyces sp. R35]|uniref:Uncharacterized protein n=1 Tax=Streptomyces sp. R35 TaxID=3238630 RepID=A0AB39S314_9ACTN